MNCLELIDALPNEQMAICESEVSVQVAMAALVRRISSPFSFNKSSRQ